MIKLNDFDIEAYKRKIEAIEAVKEHQKFRIQNYINKNGFSWFENFLDWVLNKNLKMISKVQNLFMKDILFNYFKGKDRFGVF